MDPERASWARTARRPIRANDRAVLATARAGDGWPFASFVLAACDHRAAPLPLLSDLAEHCKNLVHESRASLLFDGAAGLDRPPAGARVTVIGRLEVCADGVSAARFVRRHPDAGRYASFADFNLFRMSAPSAHPVAGFGVVRHLDAAEILPDAGAAAEFGDAEAAIVERVNRDHAEDMARCAAAPPGFSGPGWSMTGVDPEGCDLRRGGDVARLDFDRPAADAAAAKAALARLFQAARSRAR